MQPKCLLIFQENTADSVMENVSVLVVLISVALLRSSPNPNATRETQAKTFQVPETGACILEKKEAEGDRRI